VINDQLRRITAQRNAELLHYESKENYAMNELGALTLETGM
jgi:hypothetical protein